MILQLPAPPAPVLRRIHRCAVLALLALAACAPRPSSSSATDASRCGAGKPAPWCAGVFPGDDPPASAADRRALVEALAAACPPPAAADPAPGLSEGARRPEELPPGVRCMTRAPAAEEAEALAAILAVTPEDHPDRAEIADRLADASFRMERESHRACRAITVPEQPSRSTLAVVAAQVRSVTRDLRLARRRAKVLCEELQRDHPEHEVKAACPEAPAEQPPLPAEAPLPL